MIALLRHSSYIAARSLRHSWKRSALLAIVLGVSLGLPVALTTLLAQASTDMRARAAVSPLLLGARGSEADLVFGTLFFAAQPARGLAMRDLARVEAESLATAIPIAVGATARKTPVVGTTIDYFAATAQTARGRMFATIGECVVGANAARALGGVQPGDRFFTDPASLSDLAGVFPLELTVTGVLAPTQSPDDDAIFVDLRTMWTIRGLGHRHDEPAQSAMPGAVIGTVATASGDNKIAGEALPIARAAAEGVASDFHFHGSTDDFPIDGAIVRPVDAKAQAILLGRFTGTDERLQLMRPDLFTERVLERIFGVGRVLGAVAGAIALLVALVATSTFALSIRLRADELALMRRLGASRGRVAVFIAAEAMALVCAGLAIATAIAACTPLAAPFVLRAASGGL